MSLKKLASQQNQFTRHVSFCKAIPNDTPISALELRLQQVNKLYAEFEANQTALEETLNHDKMEESYVVRTQIEDYYYLCYANLQERINAVNEHRANQGGSQKTVNNVQEVKLPKIEIAQFSGNYEDWTSFKDLFVSMIHNNKSISSVQKLHYLKSNVKGDADTLLKSIPVTEANYETAWKKLIGRFDNKRFIVDSLLKNFFGQPKVLTENHKDIKQLIDKSSEIIQSLKVQGIPVAQWDAILVHVVVSKLDSATHKEWGLLQKKDELPKYKDLEEFLRLRWQSLEMIVGEEEASLPSNVPVQHGVKRTQSFGDRSRTSWSTMDQLGRNSSARCFYCQDASHKIINCSGYGNLDSTGRINFIRNNRLCFNCLASGHSSSNCTSNGRCRICNNKHHTSIHTENRNYSGQSSSTAMKTTATAINSENSLDKRVLLATAVVYIYASSGEKYPAKALLDLGSDNSVIKEKLAKKLGLTQKPEDLTIRGLGDVEVSTRNSAVSFQISSHIDPTLTIDISATTMEKSQAICRWCLYTERIGLT